MERSLEPCRRYRRHTGDSGFLQQRRDRSYLEAKSYHFCFRLHAFWNDVKGEIVLCDSIDISIAVATEKGLMTPIVRNADQKSISAISLEVAGNLQKYHICYVFRWWSSGRVPESVWFCTPTNTYIRRLRRKIGQSKVDEIEGSRRSGYKGE